jgi:hypothetical protein
VLITYLHRICRKWEEEHAQVLKAKADAAKSQNISIKEQAKSDLATFHKAREESIARAKVSNRTEEKNYLQDMETTMAKGSTWEKVTKLCDLKPKIDAKGVPGKSDRMRRLLAELKNQKDE